MTQIGSNDYGSNCKECDGTCNGISPFEKSIKNAIEGDKMCVYITFGQIHRHTIKGVVFDKDSVAEIPCSSYGEGREKAFELFGDKFATSYTKEEIEKIMHYFPRRIINVNHGA